MSDQFGGEDLAVEDVHREFDEIPWWLDILIFATVAEDFPAMHVAAIFYEDGRVFVMDEPDDDW